VLIYIGPSPDGLCVFRADGQYPEPKGGTSNVFREGDVYVRDGTQSRRWQQPHIARILGRIRATEKERWRAEVVGELQAIIAQGTAAQSLARGPAHALTWRLDAASLEQSVIEQVRSGDLIPLRLMLDRVAAESLSVLESDNQEDFELLLDRLACL